MAHGGDGIASSSSLFSPLKVCREQDLLLFLQDHTAFTLVPEQRFQPDGIQEVDMGISTI